MYKIHQQCHSKLPSRGGHGIPKCSPCPSVFFFNATGSVRPFPCLFWVGKYVCPSYGLLKFLKSAKLGRKSVRSFIKKLRSPYLPKNVKKSLNYRRCDVETSGLGLLTLSCRLHRSLVADCFCLAEICWFAVEMFLERKGKKQEWERNWKQRFSFLSRSSIF